MLRSFLALATAAVFAATPQPADARARTADRIATPFAPAPAAAAEVVGGTLEALPVLDARTGASISYFYLRQADGTQLSVKWLGFEHAIPGAQVRLEGKRNEDTFFVASSAVLERPRATDRKQSADTKRYTGKLEILHADDFDRGRAYRVYTLADGNGGHVTLSFPAAPEILEAGMSLAVDGVPAGDGITVEARAIEIHAGADEAQRAADMTAMISGTTPVIVILIKFTDTTAEPFTQAAIQSTMFSGASSVANFYREASYQKHTLSGAVTPWLRARFARPTSCDYNRIANEAIYLAQQAGYNLSAYQRRVYVFPKVTACGWWGLGGGIQAWVNDQPSLLVFAHELGHTFGVGHASTLDCGTVVVGGSCVRSEYGDANSVMGQTRAAHFSALHKQDLGYFSAGQVKTHAGGTVTYTLSPYETAGGSTYAVVVPASATRNYWIEWRQPIGFDAALTSGVTNGALLHIGPPSDYAGCESCLLDMTPATTGFTDGALPVGATYFDATTGTMISVLSKTATALTVQVSTGASGTFADVPPTHAAYAAIESLAFSGITNGCATNPLRFCPDLPVSRAEMAVFIERAKRGASFTSTATGAFFADVSATYWAGGFIEQLYTDGITTGCASNPLRYCPTIYITRGEMAPMLVRARYGATFNPGTATGTIFTDVPASHPFAAWIERAYQYGISLGCSGSPRKYCPNAQVTRAQMAMFLQRAFALPPAP